jgi:hypothetical protein
MDAPMEKGERHAPQGACLWFTGAARFRDHRGGHKLDVLVLFRFGVWGISGLFPAERTYARRDLRPPEGAALLFVGQCFTPPRF